MNWIDFQAPISHKKEASMGKQHKQPIDNCKKTIRAISISEE